MCNRLDEVWHHFVYVEQFAEERGQTKSSTTPCSPAPSRHLIIVRDDIQAAPSGMFLSFEGILSSVDNAKVNPYEKHSSQNSRSFGGTFATLGQVDDNSSIGSKTRWGLLKSIIPFSSSSTNLNRKGSPKPNSGKDLPALSNDSHLPNHLATTRPNPSETRRAPYRSLSFKFSLEWADQNKRSLGRERRVTPPRLPPMAEAYFKGRKPSTDLNVPCKPEGSAIGSSKYTGRAIAEWALLINECRNFYERRKADGVPTQHLVEIPSLSVEPFRKL